MSVMAIDKRRFDFLCQDKNGLFYWDKQEKTVIMADADGTNIRGAGAYVVSKDHLGYWRSKHRPFPRIDLEAVKAAREE